MGLMKKLLAKLTPEQVADRGEAMKFKREWGCSTCDSRLKIRSREDHGEGASNFMLYPESHMYRGHSILQPSELNWAGLAEERGWRVIGDVSPKIVCPACQRGMTMKAYKEHRRMGGL